MPRTVIFQTACYQKVPEIKWHFIQYGIELVHEKNKFMEINNVIRKYAAKYNIMSIIRERSALVKPNTTEWSDLKQFTDAEHLSELNVFEVKNNAIVNELNYAERTFGYIDLITDATPANFGWDNIFYLWSNHQNYVELAKSNVKISSRDACITKYIRERLYYSKKIDLAHNPQYFIRSVDFKTDGIRDLLNNLIKSNPKMVNYGIAALLNYVYANGIYFVSPLNRRIKLNWHPGINGIPFTRKEKDQMHELTYMIHDFCHYAIRPDLIFTGNHTKLNYKLYMIARMMSEAITIVLADMIFVHSIIESGSSYTTVAERKIYPLFKKLDLEFNSNFMQSLYTLLEANVNYCLLGDDTFFKALLKNPNSEESIEGLDEYENKYSQFYIQDYRWTQNNYQKMVTQSECQREWYRSVQSLNLKYDLGLVSVDAFKIKLCLTDDTNVDDRTLIKAVFDYVFEHNIKQFFVNNQVNNDYSISHNNLTKAFVRYMCNQIYIFDKLKHDPDSAICKNKIMNYLMSDSTTEITFANVENIRSFYKHYLESCYNKNLLTIDDLHTFDELYSIIDPFVIDYDTKYPEPLGVVANKILNSN